MKNLASGDLLVHTLNVSKEKLLLKLQFIHDIEVEAFITVSMNSCRGVTSQCNFVDIDETEITDSMADHDVIDTCKKSKMVDGTRKSAASVIFTFSALKLPDRVHVGCDLVPVCPYILNSLRYINCQLYGHLGKACRSSHVYCGRCLGESITAD